MPLISRFFGITIWIYWDDHAPPHFHARYNEFNAKIEIETLTLSDGKLPPRVLGFVVEWAMQHKAELMDNWQKAQNDQPLKKINPLQ